MSSSDNKNNKALKPNTSNSKDTIKTSDNSTKKTGLFTRIFAILGLVVIVGLYVLSFVASVSDWENSFGIFVGALAATIFVPIVIYLIRLFSNKDS